MPKPTLDEHNRRIILERAETFNQLDGPRVGDFVDFADGIARRISYIWPTDINDPATTAIQTSDVNDNHMFHLDVSNVEFSGSLYRSIPGTTLTQTGQTRLGRIWIPNHGFTGYRHQILWADIKFRVYTCPLTAPRT